MRKCRACVVCASIQNDKILTDEQMNNSENNN